MEDGEDNLEATVPTNAVVSENYNWFGGIEAAIFSCILLSALSTSLFALRTITALPMTLVLDEAWKAVSQQRRLSDFRVADIAGTAGAYLRTSLTGLAIACATLCTCAGIVVGVGSAFRLGRVQNLLVGTGRRNRMKKKYKHSKFNGYMFALIFAFCAGGVAAVELGVGIFALRWWYGEDDLDEVAMDWPRSVACGVVGGLLTAALQCRRAFSRKSLELRDEAVSGPSDKGADDLAIASRDGKV